MDIIYICQGKHFKAYDSAQGKVLEHPSDSEEVHLEFCLNSEYLYIFVTDYIETNMRILGQKKRIDIYILQSVFKPFLRVLKNSLAKINIKAKPMTNWKYGNPIARNGRQNVPSLTKLAEVASIAGEFPIGNKLITFSNATAIIDSEIPGEQQSKWRREGGIRQIHFGIFSGAWNYADYDIGKKIVFVKLPAINLENDFLGSIKNNWIE